MRGLALLALLAACGGGDDSGGDGGGVDFLYRTCFEQEHVGTFSVTTLGVEGRIHDTVAPLDVPEVVNGGVHCSVRRSPDFFCDPACDVGTTCAHDGTCVPLPVRLSAGDVTITGLSGAVTMPARAPDYSYTNPDPLPDPAFEPGADIQLAASGGDVEAFALAGVGVAPIAGVPDDLAVAEGEPLEVTWTAGPDDRAFVRILLDFAQHGGPHIYIDCEVVDTGAYTVPADLVQELLDSEVSGFPGAVLTRRTVMTADLEPGCVDLVVQSSVAVPVEVPGVISCTDDEPCPEPQTCQPNLTCG